jgi:hypothetical protein
MTGLKLFVVGESSGNPAAWPIEGWRAYVLAHDTAEAIRIANLGDEPAAEIVADEPQLLFTEHQDRGSL